MVRRSRVRRQPKLAVRPACDSRAMNDLEPPSSQFAIRIDSINDLFWPFEARPTAERTLSGDARWHLLDEWDRLRDSRPTCLTIYAPESERAETDEGAVRVAIRRSLEKAAGPLRRADPLSRQEKVAARIGIAFLFVSIMVSTVLDRASEDVLVEGLSQGILVIGWVALWRPAERFVVEVVPHIFNRRRIGEFADIDVRFAWV
jgi:hypothetical protein